MTGTDDSTRIEKELDQRTNDGLEVRLLWLPESDGLVVEVVDTKLSDVFEIEIDAAHALDAFHHPYAYAAHRGIAFVEPRIPAADPVYA